MLAEKREARAVGGIALVFDAAPQLAAILRDALPRDAEGRPAPGAFAAFVDQGGQVIACSDDRWVPGEFTQSPEVFAEWCLAEGMADSLLYKGVQTSETIKQKS